MDFIEALHYAWLTQAEAAEFFGVSIQTVKRWTRDNQAPVSVVQALKLLAGDCPDFAYRHGWQNWRFKNGLLWSPNGESFTPGDIRASKLDYEIIKGYEREVARLKAEIADLKGLVNTEMIGQSKTAKIIPFPVARNKSKTAP